VEDRQAGPLPAFDDARPGRVRALLLSGCNEAPRTLLRGLPPRRELNGLRALAQSVVLQPRKLALEPLPLVGPPLRDRGTRCPAPHGLAVGEVLSGRLLRRSRRATAPPDAALPDAASAGR
jgi:hypothetical protein